jgi:hypothetical protein
MKKRMFQVALLILLFGVGMIGTVAANAECECCPDERPDIEPYTELLAGQTLPVGYVYVWEDADCLYVWYEVTAEDWYLTETHLDVQCDWTAIPQTKKGNPIPGKFAYGNSFEVTDYETTWCQAIPKPACLDCGEEIAIAAHAVVVHVSEECMTFYSNVGQGITTGLGPAVLAWEPYSDTDPSAWDTQVTHGFTSGADWIWETYRVQSPVDGSVVDFWQTVTVPGDAIEITSGDMYITCDNGYELYVNEMTTPLLTRQLGAGWRGSDLTQPFVDTNGWQSVESIDISAALQPGANQFWIATANEYMGALDGQSPGTIDSNPAGLIYEGQICYKVVDQEETAMGDGDDFPGANWFMWFGYEGMCPRCDCDDAVDVKFYSPFSGVDDTTGWSATDAQVTLANQFNILDGDAVMTGWNGATKTAMTQRGTRGLGVLPSEPDEIDQNERIQVDFREPYCVSYVEVRSLYATEDNVAVPPEEATVVFVLDGNLVEQTDIVGTGTNGADNGVASYTPTEPIVINSLRFRSAVPGDPYNEFAVAGFRVCPFQFEWE